MADVNVQETYTSVSSGCRQKMLWVSPTVGYFFYIEEDTGIPKYIKTTTGPAGLAGAIGVTLGAADNGVGYDQGCWCSWEGENGFSGLDANVIHVFWTNGQTFDIYTRTLTLDTDTLGTQQTVHNGSGSAYAYVSCSTITPNGDIYVVGQFSTTVPAEKFMARSQDGGATWADVAVLPIAGTLAFGPLMPWTLWDGADEDVVWIYQETGDSTVYYSVYDASENTWSTPVSIGNGGEYLANNNIGNPYGAIYLPIDIDGGDEGTIFFTWRWDDGVDGKGIRFFKLTSTGQDDISLTSLAEMVPDVDPYAAVFSGQAGLTLSIPEGVFHGWYTQGVAADIYGRVRHTTYTPRTNTWSSPEIWDEDGGDSADWYRGIQAPPSVITEAFGGSICPMFWNNPGTGQEWWVTSVVNAYSVPAGSWPPNQSQVSVDATVGVLGDTDVIAQVAGMTTGARQRMIWISPTVGYLFYIEDGTTIPKYKKTTTGPPGLAAATPVTIGSSVGGTNDSGMAAVWELEHQYALDNVIHIFYVNNDDTNLYHKSLALDTDTLSAEHTVHGYVGGISVHGWSISSTVTSNGDIYLIFKGGSDTGDWKLYRSQNDGVSWTAIGGQPPMPATTVIPSQVILPWIHWDGSSEDIVLISQDYTSDDVNVYVYDVSTTTWSSVQTIGDDGDYIHLNECAHSACYRASDGKIYGIANWYHSSPNGAGVRTFELSSSGQGNITITSKADMIPSVGEGRTYFDPAVALTIVQSTGKLYGWSLYDPGFASSNFRVSFAEYDIGANTWTVASVWDESGGIGATRYARLISAPNSIATAEGGVVCPMWYKDPSPTGQEYWTINSNSGLSIESPPPTPSEVTWDGTFDVALPGHTQADGSINVTLRDDGEVQKDASIIVIQNGVVQIVSSVILLKEIAGHVNIDASTHVKETGQSKIDSTVYVFTHSQVIADASALVHVHRQIQSDATINVFFRSNGEVQVDSSLYAKTNGQTEVDASVNAKPFGIWQVEIDSSVIVILREVGQVQADATVIARLPGATRIDGSVIARLPSEVQTNATFLVIKRGQSAVDASIYPAFGSQTQADGSVQVVVRQVGQISVRVITLVDIPGGPLEDENPLDNRLILHEIEEPILWRDV